MFVTAHICFNRQIASRGRSKESKCSIQGGLCHLSKKLTAITGIGFPIPALSEPCLPLQWSCLTPTSTCSFTIGHSHLHHVTQSTLLTADSSAVACSLLLLLLRH